MTSEEIENLLRAVDTWAQGRADIEALAVVGSWSAGTARPDSDLDLIVLVSSPGRYRDDVDWVAGVDFANAGFRVEGLEDARYGDIWSRHIRLVPAAEVEFTFADGLGARAAPADPAKRKIVAAGMRIELDREGRLHALMRACAG